MFTRLRFWFFSCRLFLCAWIIPKTQYSYRIHQLLMGWYGHRNLDEHGSDRAFSEIWKIISPYALFWIQRIHQTQWQSQKGIRTSHHKRTGRKREMVFRKHLYRKLEGTYCSVIMVKWRVIRYRWSCMVYLSVFHTGQLFRTGCRIESRYYRWRWHYLG